MDDDDNPTKRPSSSSRRRASTPDAFVVAARTCPGCIDVAAAAADGGAGGGGGGASASAAAASASCFPSSSSSSSSSRRGHRACFCCRREGFCNSCCRRYLVLDPERVHRQWAQLRAQQREQGAAAAAIARAAATSVGGAGGRGATTGGGGGGLFSASATAGGASVSRANALLDAEQEEDGGHGWGWLEQHNRRAEEERARAREEGERRRREAASRLEAAVARAAAKAAAKKGPADRAKRRSSSQSAHSGRIPTSPQPPDGLGGNSGGGGGDGDGNNNNTNPAPLASFAPPADEVWDSLPNTPRVGPPLSLGPDEEEEAEEPWLQEAGGEAAKGGRGATTTGGGAAARRPFSPSSLGGGANPSSPAFPPVPRDPQRVCGACFDRHVAYDPARDHDAHGPPEPPFLSCTRPPVVLLPGALESRAALAPLAEALGREHFRAEVLDLPGLGSRWREELTPQAAVEAVDAAVKRGLARGHGRVLLCGHGMGGFLAVHYASLKPEALVGVVATGCSRRADDTRGRVALAAAGAALALAGDQGAAAGEAGALPSLVAACGGAGLFSFLPPFFASLDAAAWAGGGGGGGGGHTASAAPPAVAARSEQLDRCFLRNGGADRAAWPGCAAVLRACGDMPAQLRLCREGRVPVLLGGAEGGALAERGDERACLEALGPYGHHFSIRGVGGGGSRAFGLEPRGARAWAAAVAAFCDERI